jgi:hypothetical protein
MVVGGQRVVTLSVCLRYSQALVKASCIYKGAVLERGAESEACRESMWSKNYLVFGGFLLLR